MTENLIMHVWRQVMVARLPDRYQHTLIDRPTQIVLIDLKQCQIIIEMLAELL